jgi:4-oxalocrotonate tautomerase
VPYVHVTLAEGRTLEQKQALMAGVAKAVHEALDAPLESVRVWITEVDPAQLSIGGVPLDEVRARRAAASQPDGSTR